MGTEKHPYAIIQRRIDIVIRVPAWAQGTINKGDQVYRLDDQTVYIKEYNSISLLVINLIVKNNLNCLNCIMKLRKKTLLKRERKNINI